MTAYLLLLVALGGADATVIYRDVPAEIARVRVYEWREGRPPVEFPTEVNRDGDAVSIRGKPGALVIALFLRGADKYLLDGPFRWPGTDGERTLDRRWRRSISMEMRADEPDDGPVEWLMSSADTDAWPRCVRDRPRITCWGVPVGTHGVAFYRSQDRVWWSVVGSTAAPFRSADWGRLLIVRRAGPDPAPTGPLPHMSVRLQYPASSPQRARSVRLETADVPRATSVPVGPAATWVAGREIPDASWIEVRDVQAGPVYLPLRELADGPSSLPVHVALQESRVVDGAALGQGDAPASGALITLFRAIEPAASMTRERDPPRRVYVAEMTADERGAFRFDGLGEAQYEIVAWHPQLGRASVTLEQAIGRVEVHLQPSGVIRGRVVAGGRPLEGVDVIGVPDQDTVRNAADLLDVKGGDARTGRDGRFAVFVPSAGGELRIGGGRFAVRRIPLPRPAPASLDLGDIDLGAPIAISVVLNDDPECVVRAAGPVGRTGLQVVHGTRTAPGLHTLLIPEPGFWEFGLWCGERERALSPGVVEIGPGLSGKEVRFVVR